MYSFAWSWYTCSYLVKLSIIKPELFYIRQPRFAVLIDWQLSFYVSMDENKAILREFRFFMPTHFNCDCWEIYPTDVRHL